MERLVPFNDVIFDAFIFAVVVIVQFLYEVVEGSLMR